MRVTVTPAPAEAGRYRETGPAIIEHPRPDQITPSQAGQKLRRLEQRRTELTSQVDAAELALEDARAALLQAIETGASQGDLKKLKRLVTEAEREASGLRDQCDVIELGLASFAA